MSFASYYPHRDADAAATESHGRCGILFRARNYVHNLRAAKHGSIFVLNIGTYRDRAPRNVENRPNAAFHSAFSRREKSGRMTNDRTKSVPSVFVHGWASVFSRLCVHNGRCRRRRLDFTAERTWKMTAIAKREAVGTIKEKRLWRVPRFEPYTV